MIRPAPARGGTPRDRAARTLRGVAALALAALAVVAFSGGNEVEAAGWYVGASAGEADLGFGPGRFTDGSISGAVIDADDTAWKAYLGRRVGKFLRAEIGYVDFNNDFDNRTTFSGTASGTGGFPPGPVTVDVEPVGAYVSNVLTIFGRRRLAVSVRLGWTYWEADVTTTTTAGVSRRDEDGTDLTYGANVEYRVLRGLVVRGEWERFRDLAGEDADLTSVGVQWRFGR